jgi:hypothetical protein
VITLKELPPIRQRRITLKELPPIRQRRKLVIKDKSISLLPYIPSPNKNFSMIQ